MAAKQEKKTEEKVDEVITAVYRVNLHCQKCAQDMRKPLMSTQGVHNVDVDFEKSKIKVKGVIDAIKIHNHIERLSRKKVELVSPQVKMKESILTEKKIVIQTDETPVHTISMKVHMHCDKCEHDLRKKLLKHRGIYNVKTDIKAQTLTVQGTIESDKLLVYLRKKVHKHAEIMTSKAEKKDEKKEKQKKEEEEKNKKPKVGGIPVESTEMIEFQAENKVEVKTKEGNAPYFIHHVYAPQLFSDENPHACFIL